MAKLMKNTVRMYNWFRLGMKIHRDIAVINSDDDIKNEFLWIMSKLWQSK